MRRSELFHVGLVVADLEVGRERLGRLLGLTWGPVVEIPELPLRDGGGRDLVLPNRLCYSTEPPYIELIQEVPGSIWTCNRHSNIHHIGFFSDALADDSTSLGTGGCPLELCGRGEGQEPTSFAYHRIELGVRVELVDSALRPGMEATLFSPG